MIPLLFVRWTSWRLPSPCGLRVCEGTVVFFVNLRGTDLKENELNPTRQLGCCRAGPRHTEDSSMSLFVRLGIASPDTFLVSSAVHSLSLHKRYRYTFASSRQDDHCAGVYVACTDVPARIAAIVVGPTESQRVTVRQSGGGGESKNITVI